MKIKLAKIVKEHVPSIITEIDVIDRQKKHN